MNNTQMTQHEQVEINFKSFQELLPTIIQEHRGKHALMKDTKIIAYFDTHKDAMIAGELLYGNIYEDGRYSVQEVTDKLIQLGMFTYLVYG